MSSVVRIPKHSIPPGSAKGFQWTQGGKILDGVVVFTQGKYFIYQNLCRHLPITLDCADGNFLSQDGTHFQCHMHGALYEFNTGKCIAGPCIDDFLKRIPFQETADEIIIQPNQEP